MATKPRKDLSKDAGCVATPLTNIANNGFFTVDRNWTVKYWNKAAEKLLNVQAADIIGKNLWEEIGEAVPAEFRGMCHNAFIKDVPTYFEEYWENAGEWFDIITYHCDQTLSISFRVKDHSADSKHSQQQLEARNELYRFVTEITNDCLWDWNLETHEILWIDGGHKRVFGYLIVNAVIPQVFWENHLYPGDKERVLDKLHKIFAEGNISFWEDEYKFQRADGSYAYVHDRAHIIYDVDKVAVRMIGATQDITARKSVEIKLLESERALVQEKLSRQKAVTNAVLTAQEHERAEIGKDLHDNLNQILGAAKLYIELAKTDEENREMCLDKSCGFIMNVIEEIRRISKSLATPGMGMSLFESIRMLVDDLRTVHQLKIEFEETGVREEDMDDRMQLAIFRIVQEQLNNILKHAKATRAKIGLTRKRKSIVLSISDNGEGCNISEEEQGVGNINIRSRVELYHGNVDIVSKPGEGYHLKVELRFPTAR